MRKKSEKNEDHLFKRAKRRKKLFEPAVRWCFFASKTDQKRLLLLKGEGQRARDEEKEKFSGHPPHLGLWKKDPKPSKGSKKPFGFVFLVKFYDCSGLLYHPSLSSKKSKDFWVFSLFS